ncbi:hypothetical protein mistaenkt_18 [Escherichia phage mistaenkt]|uniref:Uncharacterized protein n=1 Tax=Escherichia phage mistaenkt TaxID=2696420 RepID=A0A6B9WTB4_9CAUD|nr:hypothetical protein mistaenkt_18 [Escherichia phage mistaenkt]
MNGRTTTTKHSTNQELFFSSLQIFLLTFGERGSKRGRWAGLALSTYLHNSKMIFLARHSPGLHVLKMKKLFGVHLHKLKMNFPFGVQNFLYRFLSRLLPAQF